MSRITSILEPDGSTVTSSYVGNCTTATDEAGKTRKSCADSLDRITQVYEDPAVLNFETDYTYDALSNLLTVNQKGGSANSANWRNRSFTYDSLSRLLTASNPESGSITYTYDPNGNLLTRVSPKPNPGNTGTVTTTYTCDALNRLKKKTYSGLTTPTTPTAQYGFDGTTVTGCNINPPVITSPTNRIGRMSAECSGQSSSSFSYDPMGRQLIESRSTKDSTVINFKTAYTYNLDGSLKTLTYPSGDVLTYTPGGAGRPILLSDSANSFVGYTGHPAAYAPSGSLASMTNGHTASFAGITTSNAYNSRLQPAILSAATPSNTILSLSYNFHLGTSDNGNLYQIINGVDSTRSATFAYDNLNRIQQANTIATTGTNCWGETYTIDAWGNLTNRGGVSGMTGCATEGLSSTASTKNQLSILTYDQTGNVTSDGGSNQPTYDVENRIATDASVTYSYDAEGIRIKKSSGTMYWTGAGGEFLTEASLTGTINEEYIYFNGVRIARVDRPSGAVHYYFSDHLGSASIITDALGTVTKQDFYFPYGGEQTSSTGSDPNHYKFTGKERDAETGLDYFNTRYLGSSMGRFLSPDPLQWISWQNGDKDDRARFEEYIANPQNFNLYAYVRNNPLIHTDPTGESVYAIFYTIGNTNNNSHGGDNEFKRAAETRKKEIESSKGFDSKKDKVVVIGVNSKEDLKSAIEMINGMDKQYGKVAELSIFSHSGEDGPVFPGAVGASSESRQFMLPGDGISGGGIDMKQLRSLHINWESNAWAGFFGCHTQTFADAFAKTQGVRTSGFRGGVDFYRGPEGKWYQWGSFGVRPALCET